MPKICYEPKTFGLARLATIERAETICRDYAAQGYSLTLRQLYYRFVASGWIENTERSYKNLGSAINDARLAGLLDWDWLEDRTRNAEVRGPGWDDPRRMLRYYAEQFTVSAWRKQPYYVEVWVEKEALADVIAQACAPLRVTTLACRGYMSQSEQWASAQRLLRKLNEGKNIVIYHLGDHDPSGIDMSRDNAERLFNFLQEDSGLSRSNLRASFSFERIALTMDQIEQYQPPPNPAKVTDARFNGYQAVYGDESWELDALPPDVLDALVRDAVESVLDRDLFDAELAREEEITSETIALIDRHGHELQHLL